MQRSCALTVAGGRPVSSPAPTRPSLRLVRSPEECSRPLAVGAAALREVPWRASRIAERDPDLGGAHDVGPAR